MSTDSYSRPESLDTAKQLLARDPEATVVGGGQTLLPLVREGVVDLDHAVDISDVPELTRLDLDAELVTIGSAVTYRDLLDSEVGSYYPIIGDTVEGIADRQVRAMGTVGGALASGQTALDLIPVLYCLDATVVIGSADGTRRVDVAELYQNATLDEEIRGGRTNFLGLAPVELDTEELIERVEIPVPSSENRRGGDYRKQTNVAGGWTVAGVGTTVSLSPSGDRIDSARVGLAAVGETGATAPAVERALDGAPATQQTVDEAVAHLDGDIDPQTTLSSASYVQSVAKTLISRSIRAAIERAGGTLS
ncbi:FAD binding domain-containing protein [Halovenus marina]|uniref:FAD binding domain-containing protein n=1 Tax=Halovenus marina TaxID=3396621 RepID=UPI003F56A5F1